MAFQDRPYYREGGGSTGNPLLWLVSGSVPLFNVFGIYVRAHASLIVTIALVLLFGLGQGFTWQDRVQSMAILFLIVLLHEFGHCFTARWVGGEADEILMHPLGGLALTRPPHRPLPMFLTVAGGPAVNVLICLIAGTLLWALFGWLPWNPFRFHAIGGFESWLNVWRYAFWIYQVSLMLLAFNLLPIFPLDGGQMLQAVLWPKFGYYRSMNFACITGMIGAVLGGMVALANSNLMLAIIAMMGFMTCLNMRRQLLAAGPYAFSEQDDFSAAYEAQTVRRRKPSRWAVRRVNKAARAERIEQQKIDVILAKVSAHGMNSLTWWEKRTLRKATERQRQAEMSRPRHH
jgi:stage IV sporulation protein FB